MPRPTVEHDVADEHYFGCFLAVRGRRPGEQRQGRDYSNFSERIRRQTCRRMLPSRAGLCNRPAMAPTQSIGKTGADRRSKSAVSIRDKSVIQAVELWLPQGEVMAFGAGAYRGNQDLAHRSARLSFGYGEGL